MPKTAVIIGATGAVGSALLGMLLRSSGFNRVVVIGRRAIALTHPKLKQYVIDFDTLDQHSQLFKGDVLFSCLGTTKRQAGSLAAQRKVDVDFQLIAAQHASSNGVAHYCLVSSSAASTQSASAYLKMKAELEQQVVSLPFATVSIFRPSLILAQRSDLRIAEKVAGILLSALSRLPYIKRYRPITADQVAAKMLAVSQLAQAKRRYYILDELFQ